MQSIRVQIRITEDMLERLDKMAADRGLSRSAMIRLLIAQASNGGRDHDLPPLEINDQ